MGKFQYPVGVNIQNLKDNGVFQRRFTSENGMISHTLR